MERKAHTPNFKFTCVMETFKAASVSEVARRYGINPNQLSTWRKQLLDHGATIFETTPDREIAGLKNKLAKMEQIIGKKEVELNLIKNFADFYISQNGN